jgi:tetratricopeptide (TPR) repeat protein
MDASGTGGRPYIPTSAMIRRLFLALVSLLATGFCAAQPAYVPASEAQVLQRVPAASDPAVARMAALRARMATAPGNVRQADELARAYVDFGRKVGDAHYAGYAEAVIAPWTSRPDAPAAVLVTYATLLQYRHEFAKARALLQEALAKDPKLAQASLSLATLDMVQGDYASAASHCSEVSRHGGVTLGLACAGNLRLYTGQAAQGMALLARIDGEGARALGPWIQGLLAEGAERLGRFDEAEAHHRKALALAPGDNFLLVAYADFLLDRGRPKDVLPLLADYSDSDTAYLRLALAHAALRTPEASRYRWVMTARLAAYAQRGGELFGREEARFLLMLAEDPDAALAAALRNFDKQREPADARIVLEAALAAHHPEAAAGVVEFLARSKLEDPRVEALVRAVKGAAS